MLLLLLYIFFSISANKFYAYVFASVAAAFVIFHKRILLKSFHCCLLKITGVRFKETMGYIYCVMLFIVVFHFVEKPVNTSIHITCTQARTHIHANSSIVCTVQSMSFYGCQLPGISARSEKKAVSSSLSLLFCCFSESFI